MALYLSTIPAWLSIGKIACCKFLASYVWQHTESGLLHRHDEGMVTKFIHGFNSSGDTCKVALDARGRVGSRNVPDLFGFIHMIHIQTNLRCSRK